MNQKMSENHRIISCNMCGEGYKTGDVAKRDYLCISKDWGFFSEKDGEHHEILLCEKCYDNWIKSFTIPPHITDTKELL